MEDDGFCLVVRKRKQRKIRETRVHYLDLFTCVSAENIDKVMQYALEKMCNSQFRYSTMQTISNILRRLGPTCRLAQVRAIGVGHFCLKGYQDYGCHQLAFLVLLKEHFGCSVTFQEPLTTENEKTWLKSHKIQFEEATNLKERSAVSDTDSVTLFYMPHCDVPLYNSVIYAHRKERLLQHVIILGNDLVSFAINPKYEHELAALCSYREVCESIHLPEYKESPHSFNNTALHFLIGSCPKISGDEPKYDFYRLQS